MAASTSGGGPDQPRAACQRQVRQHDRAIRVFLNLDGDAGCDPAHASGLHSQGLGALANVTGHELSEARTDPSTTSATGAGGRFDSQGAENGDKCAWTDADARANPARRVVSRRRDARGGGASRSEAPTICSGPAA